MTRLDATLQTSTAFRLGIFDYRSDGRPDYRYHARVFYADNALPPRARVDGGTAITVQGIGFRSNTAATIASVNAPVLAAAANQVIATAPAMPDGVQNIGLRDPATGATSTMSNALTYGAGPSDTIKLIQGSNPATPVGGQALNPVRVQVLAPDGTTPVAGASIFFISTPASSLSACGGAASCTILTDDSGHASTRVTVLQAAVINISALLAPASTTRRNRAGNDPRNHFPAGYLAGPVLCLDCPGRDGGYCAGCSPAFEWPPPRRHPANYQMVKDRHPGFCQYHHRRQRRGLYHPAPRSHGRRCARERRSRPGQPAVPDPFRDGHCRLDAAAGSVAGCVQILPAGHHFQASHGAGRRFGDCSPPGAGRERYFSGGGVASRDFAATGFSRRNHHWQEPTARHHFFVPDVGALRRVGAVHASALNRRSPGSSCDSGHSRSRKQRSSLPSPVILAGNAIGAVGLVTSSARWPAQGERHRAGHFFWQPKSAPAPLTTSADSRQLVAADRI